MIIKVCRECGVAFQSPHNQKQFCNRECKNASLRGFQEHKFWENVDKDNGPVHPKYGRCWQWIGTVLSSGYGTYNNKRAHRLSYELMVAMPSAAMVLHKCDNRLCVKPSHLFLGNAQDNMTDMKSKGRDHKAKGPGTTRLHKHGKLTPSEAAELKVLRAQGWTYVKLGHKFGIRSESARLIVKGTYHNES